MSGVSDHSQVQEDTTTKGEDAEADKHETETLSNDHTASDCGEEQEHPPTQDTLSRISQVFGMHEDTDSKFDLGEKVQSIQKKKQQPKTPKEDSDSSSEEELPTVEALHNSVRHKAQTLDTHFDAWHCKEINEGSMGWAT